MRLLSEGGQITSQWLSNTGDGVSLIRLSSNALGHKIAVHLEGFRSFESELFFPGGLPERIDVELEPMPMLELDILRPNGSRADFLSSLTATEDSYGRLLSGKLQAAPLRGALLGKHATGHPKNQPAQEKFLALGL